MFLTIIILVAYSLIWGFATNKVIKNKYYEENWFWWGFFFGFIAFIVACTKPENPNKDKKPKSIENKGWVCLKCGTKNPIYSLTCECGYTRKGNTDTSLQRSNSWKCKRCGKTVANYVDTCSCGNTRDANIALETKEILESSKENLTNLQKNNSWKCKRCGKTVANYIGTCSCGNTKDANIALEAKETLEPSKENLKEFSKESTDDFEKIKQYKELLDLGIITQTEFEVKKKQLLKL